MVAICVLCFSHSHFQTEADFNKCFKRPETYWFVKRNCANDRQAVKSDEPDGASADVFCLCCTLNAVSVSVVCLWLLCVFFIWEVDCLLPTWRGYACLRWDRRGGEEKGEKVSLVLKEEFFWREYLTKLIRTGSFRDSWGFISISLSCGYHFKQQSDRKTNIQVTQPPFLHLSHPAVFN